MSYGPEQHRSSFTFPENGQRTSAAKRRLTGCYEVTTAAGDHVEAVVPNPLRPRPPLELSGSLQELIARAALSAVRKEAVLSSQIAGTQSPMSDLLERGCGSDTQPGALPGSAHAVPPPHAEVAPCISDLPARPEATVARPVAEAEILAWLALGAAAHALRPGVMAAQVVGEWMEPLIPSGFCCHFWSPA